MNISFRRPLGLPVVSIRPGLERARSSSSASAKKDTPRTTPKSLTINVAMPTRAEEKVTLFRRPNTKSPEPTKRNDSPVLGKTIAPSKQPYPAALSSFLEISQQLKQPARKDIERWSHREYTRTINQIVNTMPPERMFHVIKSAVSSPLIADPLRIRMLVLASRALLRRDKFTGALAIYKLIISKQFAPPVSLVTAIYREIARRSDHQGVPAVLASLGHLSLGSLGTQALALLLSTLEKSSRPDIMETIVQDYATQVSPSCLTDVSVVVSMIRGYCATNQLNMCYTWFYRFRKSLAAKDKNNPATPYLCLMTASRKISPANTWALHRIAEMMQEDGIPLFTAAYNEILACEIHNRQFKRAFSLHSVSTVTVRPDAYTFALMFDALWKNETGPRYDSSSVNPVGLLYQMVRASKINQTVVTEFHVNATLRYFVNVGNFRAAIFLVDWAIATRITPNGLTARWTLEEILKRIQKGFDPSASFELENWSSSLLGGLTRDHYAHTVHLLDVVYSTRTSTDASELTRSVLEALELIRNTLISRHSSMSFASKEELCVAPALLMIRDVLRVCNDPVSVVVL